MNVLDARELTTFLDFALAHENDHRAPGMTEADVMINDVMRFMRMSPAHRLRLLGALAKIPNAQNTPYYRALLKQQEILEQRQRAIEDGTAPLARVTGRPTAVNADQEKKNLEDLEKQFGRKEAGAREGVGAYINLVRALASDPYFDSSGNYTLEVEIEGQIFTVTLTGEQIQNLAKTYGFVTREDEARLKKEQKEKKLEELKKQHEEFLENPLEVLRRYYPEDEAQELARNYLGKRQSAVAGVGSGVDGINPGLRIYDESGREIGFYQVVWKGGKVELYASYHSGAYAGSNPNQRWYGTVDENGVLTTTSSAEAPEGFRPKDERRRFDITRDANGNAVKVTIIDASGFHIIFDKGKTPAIKALEAELFPDVNAKLRVHRERFRAAQEEFNQANREWDRAKLSRNEDLIAQKERDRDAAQKRLNKAKGDLAKALEKFYTQIAKTRPKSEDEPFNFEAFTLVQALVVREQEMLKRLGEGKASLWDALEGDRRKPIDEIESLEKQLATDIEGLSEEQLKLNALSEADNGVAGKVSADVQYALDPNNIRGLNALSEPEAEATAIQRGKTLQRAVYPRTYQFAIRLLEIAQAGKTAGISKEDQKNAAALLAKIRELLATTQGKTLEEKLENLIETAMPALYDVATEVSPDATAEAALETLDEIQTALYDSGKKIANDNGRASNALKRLLARELRAWKKTREAELKDYHVSGQVMYEHLIGLTLGQMLMGGLRSANFRYWGIQLLEIAALSHGITSGIKTDQGKTFIFPGRNILKAIGGQPGIQLEPTEHFVADHALKQIGVYWLYGLNVEGVDRNQMDREGIRKAFKADIVYISFQDFFFSSLDDIRGNESDKKVLDRKFFITSDEVEMPGLDPTQFINADPGRQLGEPMIGLLEEIETQAMTLIEAGMVDVVDVTAGKPQQNFIDKLLELLPGKVTGKLFVAQRPQELGVGEQKRVLTETEAFRKTALPILFKRLPPGLKTQLEEFMRVSGLDKSDESASPDESSEAKAAREMQVYGDLMRQAVALLMTKKLNDDFGMRQAVDAQGKPIPGRIEINSIGRDKRVSTMRETFYMATLQDVLLYQFVKRKGYNIQPSADTLETARTMAMVALKNAVVWRDDGTGRRVAEFTGATGTPDVRIETYDPATGEKLEKPVVDTAWLDMMRDEAFGLLDGDVVNFPESKGQRMRKRENDVRVMRFVGEEEDAIENRLAFFKDLIHRLRGRNQGAIRIHAASLDYVNKLHDYFMKWYRTSWMPDRLKVLIPDVTSEEAQKLDGLLEQLSSKEMRGAREDHLLKRIADKLKKAGVEFSEEFQDDLKALGKQDVFQKDLIEKVRKSLSDLEGSLTALQRREIEDTAEDWQMLGRVMDLKAEIEKFFTSMMNKAPPAGLTKEDFLTRLFDLQEDALAVQNFFLLNGQESDAERLEAQDKAHLRSITFTIPAYGQGNDFKRFEYEDVLHSSDEDKDPKKWKGELRRYLLSLGIALTDTVWKDYLTRLDALKYQFLKHRDFENRLDENARRQAHRKLEAARRAMINGLISRLPEGADERSRALARVLLNDMFNKIGSAIDTGEGQINFGLARTLYREVQQQARSGRKSGVSWTFNYVIFDEDGWGVVHDGFMGPVASNDRANREAWEDYIYKSAIYELMRRGYAYETVRGMADEALIKLLKVFQFTPDQLKTLKKKYAALTKKRITLETLTHMLTGHEVNARLNVARVQTQKQATDQALYEAENRAQRMNRLRLSAVYHEGIAYSEVTRGLMNRLRHLHLNGHDEVVIDDDATHVLINGLWYDIRRDSKTGAITGLIEEGELQATEPDQKGVYTLIAGKYRAAQGPTEKSLILTGLEKAGPGAFEYLGARQNDKTTQPRGWWSEAWFNFRQWLTNLPLIGRFFEARKRRNLLHSVLHQLKGHGVEDPDGMVLGILKQMRADLVSAGIISADEELGKNRVEAIFTGMKDRKLIAAFFDRLDAELEKDSRLVTEVYIARLIDMLHQDFRDEGKGRKEGAALQNIIRRLKAFGIRMNDLGVEYDFANIREEDAAREIERIKRSLKNNWQALAKNELFKLAADRYSRDYLQDMNRIRSAQARGFWFFFPPDSVYEERSVNKGRGVKKAKRFDKRMEYEYESRGEILFEELIRAQINAADKNAAAYEEQQKRRTEALAREEEAAEPEKVTESMEEIAAELKARHPDTTFAETLPEVKQAMLTENAAQAKRWRLLKSSLRFHMIGIVSSWAWKSAKAIAWGALGTLEAL
ncbi:MAG TPA: hypothetical protein VD913_04055, partial [bacterium]|nr:hypothetical protein [bacterium]